MVFNNTFLFRKSSASFATAIATTGALLLPVSSNAALMIEAGDIDNSGSQPTYSYEITSGDMQTNGGAKVSDDAATFNNMVVKTQSGTSFVAAIGNSGITSAGLSYVFDFGSLGLSADTIQFRDTMTLFNFGTDDFIIGTSEWSVDGVNWTTITQRDSEVEGSANGHTSSTGLTPPTISLSTPASTIYYRVRLDIKSTDGDGQFTGDRGQWNRSGVNAPLFQANFTLVPEPSSLGILSLGLAGIFRRSRK